MEGMDDRSLEDLLRQRGELVASALPPAFQQNVWREIRQRKALPESSNLSVWGWLLRPQMISAVLAVAAFVGIGLGSRLPDRVASNTSDALNLRVFGQAPPALPSTLLASKL